MESHGKRVRIHLLGGLRVAVGDRVILDQRWSRRKTLALLKVVALQPGGQLLRDQLCELLWPDLEPRAATNNLHKNLYYLREVLSSHLEDPGLISLAGDIVRLRDDVEVDYHGWLAAASSARGSGDPALYRQALTYAQDELLPGDAYEEWATTEREAMRSTTAELLREASAADISAGNWDAATGHAQDLLAIEPADEDAHRALMQLYFQLGSRHRALRQFELCREALQAELGVEPSPATVALHQRLVADTPGSRAAVTARPATRLPSAPRDAGHVTHGREKELALIERALDDAALGRGSVLLLVGEAGIGKSHLLQSASGVARKAGALPLYGRAFEFDAQAPYQPLRGVLQELRTSDLGPRSEQLLDRTLYLRRLLPGASTEGTSRNESPDLQVELFEEAWELLSALARERLLVLLLDDLHWADDATLRLVHFLGRRLPGGRILIIAAARGEWSGNRNALNTLRAVLRKEGVAREVALQPLDERALRLIAQSGFEGGRVENGLLRDITERAQGSPLFARELAKSFVEEGWARFEGSRWKRRRSGDHVPVPLVVHDMLQHRLERLSHGARDLINATAVSPVPLSFQILQDVARVERRLALDTLDECIAAELLEETSTGYGFRHELLREAALAGLTTARRQELHHAVAEALLRSSVGADVGMVSYHLAESDEPWQTVPYLLEAARRADAVFAHQRAREALEQAVRLIREHEPLIEPALVPDVIEALGDLHRRLGDVSSSVPLFEEAASRYQSAGANEAATSARGKAALGHIVLGNGVEARRHIEETLQALTDHSPQRVVSRTYYLLAQLHWHSGENRDALEAAKQALLAAEDGTDLAQQAQAYEVLALACHSLGDWQQGIEYELNRQALGVSGFDTDEAFDAHL